MIARLRAAGRVNRGLPTALQRCGYRTLSLYPALGAFMSARSFQATTGVQRFYDQHDLGARELEPDSFFFNAAARMIDEHLRRQALSAKDYAVFLERLKREFPNDSFLLVRFGDHQPDFASSLIDPTLDQNGIIQRLMAYDPHYFTTYYA